MYVCIHTCMYIWMYVCVYMYVCINVCMCIHIYIYIYIICYHIHIYIYVYIYIYTYKVNGLLSLCVCWFVSLGSMCLLLRGLATVSFHNFKSQIFKLSVSNPKSKYVAYLSILSQISNCQCTYRNPRLWGATKYRLLFLTNNHFWTNFPLYYIGANKKRRHHVIS